MGMFMDLLIFFLLGLVGWRICELVRIPAAAILGPIIAVAAANCFGLALTVPVWLKPLLSILMGIMLGLRFNLQLKGLLKEVLLVGGWIILLSLVTAKVLMWTGLDKPTAIFSATPGGIAEVSLMAFSFGADPFVVSLLQFSRMISTMFIIPVLAKKTVNGEKTLMTPVAEKVNIGKKNWAVIIPLAVGSAFLFDFLHVPAPFMLGPMLSVGIYSKLAGIYVKINGTFQKYVQVGVGGLIGLNITKGSLFSFPDYILPILCLIVLLIGGSVVLAFVLHKVSKWDLTTCLLATSPAGLTPMILLSMEMGADSDRVALFQVLRLATVLLMAPLGGQLLLG